jgi:DNA repair exonuclease SbcCD nuclease subunit
MTNLFERALVFADLHLGAKNNEKQFNEDCKTYLKWLIDTAKLNNVDCIIFLGDFHHNRNSLHLSTLDYSLFCLKSLDELGIPVYLIPGNHDEYFKESRKLSSIAIADNFSNIRVFNEITEVANCLFCPWLVGNEWEYVAQLIPHSYYVFGHFELPHFMMNALIEMPDHGGLNANHFENIGGWAFTGHFHKRQNKGKVVYIGSAFPHNYSDVWDDDRGLVILDWGDMPQFIKWPEAPTYKTLKLSELLESPEDYITSNAYVKTTVDLDINYIDTQLIKDIFEKHYTPRKLQFISSNKEDNSAFVGTEVFQSIDQIVIDGLKNIDSISMDISILIDLYNGLT